MNTRTLRSHLASGHNALFDLNDRIKFRLTGEDRIRYLNGQVSHNVKRLSSRPDAFQGCLLTAKGKLQALLWINATADALRIDTDPGDADRREALLLRLDRYIIADDAAIADTTEETGLLHLLVPDAVATLESATLGLPKGVDALLAHRYGRPGIDLIGPRAALDTFQPEGETWLRVDAQTEETFRIENGLPRWAAELDESTLPVEAGLEASAIDYHKGCYIGQEIISRIKSVGHVNRQLVGFTADGDLPVGTPLYPSPQAAEVGGREAARITSSAWSFALDKRVALGYLRRGNEATTTFHAGGIEASVHPLPFIA